MPFAHLGICDENNTLDVPSNAPPVIPLINISTDASRSGKEHDLACTLSGCPCMVSCGPYELELRARLQRTALTRQLQLPHQATDTVVVVPVSPVCLLRFVRPMEDVQPAGLHGLPVSTCDTMLQQCPLAGPFTVRSGLETYETQSQHRTTFYGRYCQDWCLRT